MSEKIELAFLLFEIQGLGAMKLENYQVKTFRLLQYEVITTMFSITLYIV